MKYCITLIEPINTLKEGPESCKKDSIIIVSMTLNDNNEKIWDKLSKNISSEQIQRLKHLTIQCAEYRFMKPSPKK